MKAEFIEALEEIEKEKGISKELIFEALEAALISGYKKNFGSSQNVEVDVNKETGDVKLYAKKNVVEIVEDELLDISIEEAKKLDANYELEDIVRVEITPRNFGRIAAQTAKQVVMQKIKEAEREIVFDEFINRENEIITGIVQRASKNNILIDLGKTEGILAPSEQIQGEEYNQGDRIKSYILEVKKTTKGPQILLSRTHPGLVKRLFELEVPEIQEGIVDIYNISREAGSRTKIAVYSNDENVDPVGACVGFKGARVKAIVDELYGEKIDIITWDKDIKEFIQNSLSPAKVVKVEVDEKEKSALVVVPDYQLSLAIGKEGQNARLAAKLTNWKIDIKSESQYNSEIHSDEELIDNIEN
ncbi:transcription elongation factor NusA [Gottschalkia acidurici 9a]|uniref:Transcription termination/antitermination protein NusA n=1 Tax=Gottschalkia acidurici (strain ATCC 7906 / DSM 604 / BCRC 14475 / CIP 104303 / KCTC 5404 / NCIMB 10678 / 9a) TaxID=1128398 RepID=K0B0H1_GOTA9|nr:transcription termination factor NusA [Gottschalkia acidurici]AFS78567.1 transcription elongation factor NusA [Gottschalkia acidurici 9a]